MNGRRARAIRKPAKGYQSYTEYVQHRDTGQVIARGKRGFIRDLKRGIAPERCDELGYEVGWVKVRFPRIASTPRKGAPRTKRPAESGLS